MPMMVFGKEAGPIWTPKSVLDRPMAAVFGILGERPVAVRREIEVSTLGVPCVIVLLSIALSCNPAPVDLISEQSRSSNRASASSNGYPSICYLCSTGTEQSSRA